MKSIESTLPSLRTTILMIRHAEVLNPDDILYGRLPRFGLSELGREQALATARFLAGRRMAALYTSPLLRARQTARILTTYHPDVAIHISSKLLEVRTGYQGSPNSILKPGFSFFEPKQDPSDESIEDVWERMNSFLRHAATVHAGQTVAAVSHADPIGITRVGLQGLPFTTSSLHSVVFAGRASVTQVVVSPGAAPEISYFDVPRAAQEGRQF